MLVREETRYSQLVIKEVILPNFVGANCNGLLNRKVIFMSLIWLLERDIIPTIMGRNMACKNGIDNLRGGEDVLNLLEDPKRVYCLIFDGANMAFKKWENCGAASAPARAMFLIG